MLSEAIRSGLPRLRPPPSMISATVGAVVILAMGGASWAFPFPFGAELVLRPDVLPWSQSF